MPITDNIAEVRRTLALVVAATNLDQDGLGRSILRDQAVRIQARSLLGQSGPDGRTWAPNKEPYASSPRKRGKPIGVLTGRMLSLEEIEGRIAAVEPESAEMEYGLSSDSRQIAGVFQSGRGDVQADRPFYGLSREDEQAIVEQVEAHVAKVIERLG